MEANLDILGLCEMRVIEEKMDLDGFRIIGRGRVGDNDYNGVGVMYKICTKFDLTEEIETNARAKSKRLEGRIITFRIKNGRKRFILTVVYMMIEGSRVKKNKKSKYFE
jgi:exonuclease III